LLLVRPGRPVDALEHLVPLVAAPVRAGDVGQLERAEAAGRGDVRAAAEIEPFALAVDGERLVGGDVADDLDLVFLADAVDDLAVDLAGDGVPGQALADGAGDVEHGGVVGDLSFRSVWKLYVHVCLSRMQNAEFRMQNGFAFNSAF